MNKNKDLANISSKINESTQDFSLTFIQVISSIAVVTLHTNGCFWEFSSTERYWLTANIIECLFYFAVPVFFMITGITLIDYQNRYSTKIYFEKRIKKTLIPYIAWSILGVFILLATGKIAWGNVTFKWIVKGLISTDQIIGIYWFFRPLFCVYLCIPLFSAIEKKKKIEMAKYLLIIGFVINILVPFVISITEIGIEWQYSISPISGYLFWVLAGYYIYNTLWENNTPPPFKDIYIHISSVRIDTSHGWYIFAFN